MDIFPRLNVITAVSRFLISLNPTFANQNTMNNVRTSKIIDLRPEPEKFKVGDKVRYDLGNGEIREGEIRTYNEKSKIFSIIRTEDNIDFIDLAYEKMLLSHVVQSDPDKVVQMTRTQTSKVIPPVPFAKVITPAMVKAVQASPVVQVGVPTSAKVEPIKDKEQYLTTPEIIDGAGANSLKESLKIFKLATGDIVVAASDKGINYKTYNPHNEDRVAVIPSYNGIVVADGMGGHGHGEDAALALANAIVKSPDNIDDAIKAAQKDMADNKLGNAGTCYMYSQIATNEKGDKYLNLFQAGDVHAVVYDKNGKILFESKDESAVQEMVDDPEGIDPDQALYNPARNIVTNALFQDSGKKKMERFGPLPKGAVVVVGSDGIFDNLTADEIWGEIKGKSPRDAVGRISDVTDERMGNARQIIQDTDKLGGRWSREKYSDGYKSEPKPDNRGLAIIYIQ